MKVCNVPGCPTLTKGGRCTSCRRAADADRGSSHQRGYDREHRRRFRVGVLQRDPTCVLCRTAPSTVADHWPADRRQLVDEGRDPNDPDNGRGLCASCHGRETSRLQPGGWYDQ